MSLFEERFSANALEQTLRTNYGAGVDSDLPEDLRFIRGVASLAKKRFRAGVEGAADRPVVFLLHPTTPTGLDESRSVRRIPMIDNGLHPIGGHIWFVNYAVTEGVSLELTPEDDDGTIFQLLRDDLTLGDLPAAVIETRGGTFELRYFPKGLAKTELCETTDLTRREISAEEVRIVLDDLYRKELCSPSAQTATTSPWKDSGKHWASQHAELRIQRVLKVGLGQKFKGFLVRQEQTQVTGRLDLEIEEPHEDDRSTVTRHIILELKVLRERGETGTAYTDAKNAQTVTDGVDQARSYRDERRSRAAALCCYDLRETERSPDEVYDHVKDDAASWDVHLWLWHLYGTDADYRTSLRPATSGDGADACTATGNGVAG